MAVDVNRVKVAHIATIDLSLRFLLLNQLRCLREAGYSITGISSAGPHVTALEDEGIRHLTAPMTESGRRAILGENVARAYKLA